MRYRILLIQDLQLHPYIGPYDKFHRKYDLVKIPNYRGISDLSDNCHSRMEEIYERIVDEIER